MRVELRELCREFPGNSAGIFDLNLRVESGELMTVVGVSGAGKSTLLRLIAGLEAPDSGQILLDAVDVTRVPPQHRDIGLIAQRAALYPHLDIRRNLSIGLEMRQRHGVPIAPAELTRRTEEAIELLDLRSILDRRPEELSGGEAQRVALGRLLVRRPPIWLLDEPLAHWDAPRKLEFRSTLHLLRSHQPATMILVTHDPVEALALGSRVAVLQGGRLRQVGAPDHLYLRPADRIVAELIGWPPLNLADGVLVRAPGSDAVLRFAAADGAFHLPVPAELVTPGAEGQPVTVGIRPDELVPTSPGSPPIRDHLLIPGWRVDRAEFVPPRRLGTVRLGRATWRLWLEATVTAGATVDLSMAPNSFHWFDGRSGLRMGQEPKRP